MDDMHAHHYAQKKIYHHQQIPQVAIHHIWLKYQAIAVVYGYANLHPLMVSYQYHIHSKPRIKILIPMDNQ